ncbi:hypothetical protein DITRI_Ditri20bG0055400 [Diplodiscus trichospermus]
MECNKEEAVRAREIAEHKMQNGDFEGAKKFALKAQKLFPELENISQLLTVCDVHFYAKRKLYGSEMDWYGILQVERSADESSIKKQYRKLALLLHPDKNKFAGAEAAFKLIGEANRILSDQMSRSQYDMKCRISVKTAPNATSHQSNRASSVSSQFHFTNNYPNGSSKSTAPNSYQQAQHLTFWTLCTACGMKYQYHKDFVNRLLQCPTCRTSFIARDLGPQGYSWTQFSSQRVVPNQGPCKVSSQCSDGKPFGVHFPQRSAGSAPSPKAGSSVQVGDSKSQPHDGVRAQQKVDGCSNMRDRKKGVEIPKHNVEKPKGSGTSRNAKKKRGRKLVEESDESFETDSEIEVEDEDVVNQEDCKNNSGLNSKVNRGHPPRRSARQKQHVSYEEKLVDDDDFVSSPYKRSKVTEKPNDNEEKGDGDVTKKDIPTAAAGRSQKEVKQKASAPPEDTVSNKKSRTGESKVKEEETVIFCNSNKVSQVDSGSEPCTDVSQGSQLLQYADPEFSDFEKQRAENCFYVNQVWAIYDTLDGMPRFYARVNKVFNPGFKLRITWLEPNPHEENEQSWVDLDLPVSCGKYCNGSSEACVDRLMFSHRVDSIKSFGKRFFLVYPQKGETWALFRNWDFKWVLEPEKHKPPYEYDFVEVLTDFDEEIGIGVAHLGKLKGFVSIFQQTERDGVISFQVSPRELYRFSHRVPSFRMSGQEREGVPVGSFELDPASLPTNLDELVDPGGVKSGNHNLDNAENCSSPKFSQNQSKAAVDAEDNLTPVKDNKGDIKREASPMRRSARGSSCMLKDQGQIYAGKSMNNDDSIKDIRDCNFTQPQGSSSGDALEKINTPKKCKKSDLTTDCLKPRRSPRDLSGKVSQVNASQHSTQEDSKKCAVSDKYEKHGDIGKTQGRASFSTPVGNIHLHERDGITKSSGVSSPMSSARKTSKSECYDFKREKSEDKFEVDQIWALYSRDGMPKDYAQIKKIEFSPDFKLRVALLEMCSRPKDLKLPLCCGIFKVKSDQTKIVSCNVVSHQLRAEHIEKNRYRIYPRKGEVWAVYRSWKPADSGLGKGECDIVEVLEDNEKRIKVVVLSCVNGSKSLYRAPRSQRSTAGVLEIVDTEFARFSHQIPAFQHTGEDSRWRGYWELDPSAIPGVICLE